MRLVLGLFTLSAATIVAVWAWLGSPVKMPQIQMARGEKLYCVSYAPFRGSQSPLDGVTHIEPWQIEEDLIRLARLTDCVRTYSADYGLDRIAEIAGRHGLKVIQGLWLSSHPDKNREQIETVVELANRFPDVIRAVSVGNEVLLRGELSSTDLEHIIRAVKARIRVPVTYSDVWEFWLRNAQLAGAVDFATIHILPYWEDFPIPADTAAAHVDAIRRKLAEAFPNKEILIGEVGWPSAGRMREGALPSPVNQARVIQDVLALARRENFRVNIIEAFDQPWKRRLEGTVGGHWGLLDDETRAFKFDWGEAVSNHPHWRWQAAGGVVFAALIFGAAYAARRRAGQKLDVWLAVMVNAVAGGILIGWTIENVPIESLGTGGWIRSLCLMAAALAAPPAVSMAIASGNSVPSFWRILNSDRPRDPLAQVSGASLIVLTVLAIQCVIGLVFDPRYRDFPFAPLTAATVPFLVHSLLVARARAKRNTAELVSAALIGTAAVFILFNEGFANWQAVWLCLACAALVITLVWVRAAPD